MKLKALLPFLFLIIVISNCSKNIKYTPEFMKETSGKYLFKPDVIIEVLYENKTLFLKWNGSEKFKPIVLDETTFFVADMYKKLKFVQHPITKERYLSILTEDKNSDITYDYIKVADTFKTPSMYLKQKEYKQALIGYLNIKKQDSTSALINEHDFNRLGYNLLREKDYKNAIEVFKINVALYPDSDNVYDSLADAYLRDGDSLQAFVNYQKAYDRNTGNQRAKRYIEHYNKKPSN